MGMFNSFSSKEEPIYSVKDIEQAVTEGVLNNDDAERFTDWAANKISAEDIDQEKFQLVKGFNDIFVLLTSILMLMGLYGFLSGFSETLSSVVTALSAWGLAEYFVRKKHLAATAIGLLIAFLAMVFNASMSGLIDDSWLELENFDQLKQVLGQAALIVAVFAYLHWRRFRVPISVAGGAFAVGLLLASFLPETFLEDYWQWVAGFFGVLFFVYAMFWDASDRKRISRNSDVAFWLHLLSAPLIVHPVFNALDITYDNIGVSQLIIVLLLYLKLTTVSILIDRRVFMVSALSYLLYILSEFTAQYQNIGDSGAIAALVIGGSLLILSAFWQPVRQRLVSALPLSWQNYLPMLAALNK